MGLLPKNELKTKDITPKTFFIWGQSMSGKTYLARQFPSPVIINTDGNAKKVETPSVEVLDFETFIAVMSEIEAGNHEYKTIIIDLVDDIKTMLENYVCKKYEAETLADVPFGKAFSDVKSTWQRLMVRLSQMKYNVIFISHVVEVLEDKATVEKPSLEQKYYNMCMGRCDLSIKCRKLGTNYLQLCDNKRDMYIEDDVKDKQVLEILKGIKGVFTPTNTLGVKPIVPTVQTPKVTPVKANKPITAVKKLEPVVEIKAPQVTVSTSVVDDLIKSIDIEGILENTAIKGVQNND